jgi:hypothetical protein
LFFVQDLGSTSIAARDPYFRAQLKRLAPYAAMFAAAVLLACLSQLGHSAAGKPFRISEGVQKVSTTKWIVSGGIVVE